MRLVSELLKNSRRSDRELARALGVSQPTVSRMISRLEQEGYISEYTIIPDFNKVGYHLFALTFLCWRKGIGRDEMEEAKRWAKERALSVPPNVVLIERGMGLNFDSFLASLHKDYTSLTRFCNELKTSPYMDASRMESFVVNLDDPIHYRYLTFSTLGKHLIEMSEEDEKHE